VKYLYKVLGGMLMFGLLAMIPTGCSDSDNSSPVTPDIPTNRIYVMTIGSGVLSPAIESTGGVTELNGEPVREYILTLDDVTENTLWYTNRPERKAGTTTVQEYTALWSEVYGAMPPNAILDGFVTEPVHDGFYLNLREPAYDSGTDSLVFEVTLLGSTMDDPYPVESVDIFDIRITVFDNTPEGQINYWSFGQTAQESKLEATETEGLYKLSLIGAYPEVFQLQNAPGTRYEIIDPASLEYSWQTYFGAEPPNASLTGVSTANAGEMKLALLELDNPSHDGTNVYYDAKVLGGDDLQGDSLINMALLIDTPDGTYPLCKKTGLEAECYAECFNSGPGFNPYCCPRKNPDKYNCGKPGGNPDWWKYSLCHDSSGTSPTGDICTTYQPSSKELTTLVIENATDEKVDVFLSAGSAHASEGACVSPWTPIQINEKIDGKYVYPECTMDGDVGKFSINAKSSVTVKGVQGRCLNGTFSFKKSTADVCDMTQGEFTLNVDPDSAKDLKEGTDISLVNGNNGKIILTVDDNWWVQTTHKFVTKPVENVEGTGTENANIDGVYNYLCDACNRTENPPKCSGPPGTCSSQETCNLLRDATRQGGTVTFTWKGTNW
jgi:hypothetical protein